MALRRKSTAHSGLPWSPRHDFGGRLPAVKSDVDSLTGQVPFDPVRVTASTFRDGFSSDEETWKFLRFFSDLGTGSGFKISATAATEEQCTAVDRCRDDALNMDKTLVLRVNALYNKRGASSLLSHEIMDPDALKEKKAAAAASAGAQDTDAKDAPVPSAKDDEQAAAKAAESAPTADGDAAAASGDGSKDSDAKTAAPPTPVPAAAPVPVPKTDAMLSEDAAGELGYHGLDLTIEDNPVLFLYSWRLHHPEGFPDAVRVLRSSNDILKHAPDVMAAACASRNLAIIFKTVVRVVTAWKDLGFRAVPADIDAMYDAKVAKERYASTSASSSSSSSSSSSDATTTTGVTTDETVRRLVRSLVWRAGGGEDGLRALMASLARFVNGQGPPEPETAKGWESGLAELGVIPSVKRINEVVGAAFPHVGKRSELKRKLCRLALVACAAVAVGLPVGEQLERLIARAAQDTTRQNNVAEGRLAPGKADYGAGDKFYPKTCLRAYMERLSDVEVTNPLLLAACKSREAVALLSVILDLNPEHAKLHTSLAESKDPHGQPCLSGVTSSGGKILRRSGMAWSPMDVKVFNPGAGLAHILSCLKEDAGFGYESLQAVYDRCHPPSHGTAPSSSSSFSSSSSSSGKAPPSASPGPEEPEESDDEASDDEAASEGDGSGASASSLDPHKLSKDEQQEKQRLMTELALRPTIPYASISQAHRADIAAQEQTNLSKMEGKLRAVVGDGSKVFDAEVCRSVCFDDCGVHPITLYALCNNRAAVRRFSGPRCENITAEDIQLVPSVYMETKAPMAPATLIKKSALDVAIALLGRRVPDIASPVNVLGTQASLAHAMVHEIGRAAAVSKSDLDRALGSMDFLLAVLDSKYFNLVSSGGATVMDLITCIPLTHRATVVSKLAHKGARFSSEALWCETIDFIQETTSDAATVRVLEVHTPLDMAMTRNRISGACRIHADAAYQRTERVDACASGLSVVGLCKDGLGRMPQDVFQASGGKAKDWPAGLGRDEGIKDGLLKYSSGPQTWRAEVFEMLADWVDRACTDPSVASVFAEHIGRNWHSTGHFEKRLTVLAVHAVSLGTSADKAAKADGVKLASMIIEEIHRGVARADDWTARNVRPLSILSAAHSVTRGEVVRCCFAAPPSPAHSIFGSPGRRLMEALRNEDKLKTLHAGDSELEHLLDAMQDHRSHAEWRTLGSELTSKAGMRGAPAPPISLFDDDVDDNPFG